MFKRVHITGCVLLFMFFSAASTQASNKNASGDKLTVYTEVDLISQNNHPMFVNGLKIIKHSGLSHQVISMPWNRAFSSAKSHSNSIVFPIYKTHKRANQFHWLCPIAPSRNMYLFRLAARKDLHLLSLDDVSNKLVGVVKDSILHTYLNEQSNSVHFSLDATVYDSTNVNKLLKGRLDYVAQSEEQVVEYFNQNNLDLSLIVKEVMIYDHTVFPMCAAINLNTSPEIISTLNNAFQTLFSEEQFKPIPIKNGIKNCH